MDSTAYEYKLAGAKDDYTLILSVGYTYSRYISLTNSKDDDLVKIPLPDFTTDRILLEVVEDTIKALREVEQYLIENGEDAIAQVIEGIIFGNKVLSSLHR